MDTCSLSKNLGNVVRCNEKKLHLYSTSINCEMLGMSCLRHNKLMVLWFVFRIKDYNKRQEIQNCLSYICYLCSQNIISVDIKICYIYEVPWWIYYPY